MGKGEWRGPWHDNSNAWNKYPEIDELLRPEHHKDKEAAKGSSLIDNDKKEKKEEDGSFWILFKDFMQFFASVTINY